MTGSESITRLPHDFADRAEALLRAAANTDAGLSVYLFDGLLEWIEWANQGYEADPTACVWLGGLRWWRAQRGSLPEGAPPVPTRWVDERTDVDVNFAGATEHSLQALDSAQMPTLRDPARPDDDGPDALARSVIYALVPGLEDHMIVSLARQGAALTQGVPAAWEASCATAVIVAGLLFPADDEINDPSGRSIATEDVARSVLHHAVKRAIGVLDAEAAAEVKTLLDTALVLAASVDAGQASAWPAELRGTTAAVVVASAVYAVIADSDQLPVHPEHPDTVSVLVEQLRAAQGHGNTAREKSDLVSEAMQRWMASIT